MGRNFFFNQRAELVHLQRAVVFPQAEVNAHRVQVHAVPGDLQLAVQQAAPLGPADGHVVVLKPHNRELRHHRVAVVALVIHGVLTVRKFRPNAVG